MNFFTCDLGSFQTAVFVLDPRASEPAHKPFKSIISVPYSPMVPLDMSCWFSKPDVLGACLSSAGSKGWGTWCQAKTPHQGVPLWTPTQWLLHWGWNSLLWSSCSASSQVLFRRNCFICSWRFVVSMGGSEFRVFLCHHLELPAFSIALW